MTNEDPEVIEFYKMTNEDMQLVETAIRALVEATGIAYRLENRQLTTRLQNSLGELGYLDLHKERTALSRKRGEFEDKCSVLEEKIRRLVRQQQKEEE